MKTSVPTLLPILRSAAVGELLACLYLAPGRRWTLSELGAAARVSLPTTTREVSHLVDAGMVNEARVGRTRQLWVNEESELFAPLRRLIELTYGPGPVLSEELQGIDGIASAYVFGSWAARHQGVSGPAPNDIDAVVIGDPDADEVFEAGERARRRLHRLVSIHVIGPAVWEDPDSSDPFLHHVRANPLVELAVGMR